MARNTIRLILIAFFTYLPGKILAQLQVNLVDIEHKPIAGAIVSLYPLADSLSKISYAVSDNHGKVLLKIYTFPFRLIIKSMGFKEFHLVVSNKEALPTTIVLENNSLLIEEVLVTLNEGLASIQKDTIHYNLKLLHLKSHDNLHEILDRIPGFKVDENGKIVHAGQEINKILVNGKEVFEFQNKIALENVKAAMLESLDVIDNYQDPFRINLEQDRSEKVINLTLKEDFSNTWKGNIEVQAGFKNKYKIKPFLFYFSDKLSVFTLNNLNNIGEKDWSSADYVGRIDAYQVRSQYFGEANSKVFYAKDLTQSKGNGYLNSTTLKTNNEKYDLQTVLNYTNLSSQKLAETRVRYLGEPLSQTLDQERLTAQMLNYSVNFRYKASRSSILQLLFSNYIDDFNQKHNLDALFAEEKISFFVNESFKKQAKIYSNKLAFDMKLSNKFAWSNSWLWRVEKSQDYWLLNTVEHAEDNMNPNSHKALYLNHIEHSLSSSIRQQFGRGFQLKYIVQRHYLNNDIKIAKLDYRRNRSSGFIEAKLKTKYVDLNGFVGINIMQQSALDQKKNNYFGNSQIQMNLFLDPYKKNKIILLYDKTVQNVPVKALIENNTQSFQQIFAGNSDFVFDLFPSYLQKLSYVVQEPIEGRSFQLSLANKRSDKNMLLQINPKHHFVWDFKKVKGIRELTAEISYSQYVLKRIYPVKVEMQYEIGNKKYFHHEGLQEIEIKQVVQRFQPKINSLSSSRLNFYFQLLYDKTIIRYPDSKSEIQHVVNYLFGPRYDFKNLSIKCRGKFNLVDSQISSSSFWDLDMELSHQVSKKLTLLFVAENFLQNLQIKRSENLSLLNNQQGIEYMQSFKNSIGYSNLGIKYRF